MINLNLMAMEFEMKVGSFLPLYPQFTKKLFVIPLPCFFKAQAILFEASHRDRHMAMGFFLGIIPLFCFWTQNKMEIQLSGHAMKANLILHKLPGQSDVLLLC